MDLLQTIIGNILRFRRLMLFFQLTPSQHVDGIEPSIKLHKGTDVDPIPCFNVAPDNLVAGLLRRLSPGADSRTRTDNLLITGRRCKTRTYISSFFWKGLLPGIRLFYPVKLIDEVSCATNYAISAYGVTGGTRILDNQSHNLVFYQLNYGHMERVMGIEPTYPDWKSGALADVLHPQISPTKQ